MELKLWHSKNEEPNNFEHCLINYGGERYIDFDLVIYNKSDKSFVTANYPHPTGRKAKFVSIIDNVTVIEDVYRNMRDKIKLSDIVCWCRLSDLVLIKEDKE